MTCFKVLVSNVKDDNKSNTSKVKNLFLKGVLNEDFLYFLTSPTVLGHSFEAFRRAAAQKQMVQSTLLRPLFSGGPKGWNSGFDETHDIHNFFLTFIRTLDRYPWLLHFGFSHMITCFKVLVSNVKDDNKLKTSKLKNLFSQCFSNWIFFWISGFTGLHSYSLQFRGLRCPELLGQGVATGISAKGFVGNWND